MVSNHTIMVFMKLPTTFANLDLSGFEIDRSIRYNSVNREMVDLACSVLLKNRIRIVVRSVQAALKEIYGIGGSSENICRFLEEWRKDNAQAIKAGKGEKNLVSEILEDDQTLDESEVPEEIFQLFKQIGLIAYTFAHQKADTSISGDRIKTLAEENDLLKNQLRDFPQLQMQLDFYKAEYERQRKELQEAYLSINKQQLADSETFRLQLETLQSERNDLFLKNNELAKQLTEIAQLESHGQEVQNEIAKLRGQLEAREREVMSMRGQMQNLQAESGQKSVVESQLATSQEQLKQANETIAKLQVQIQEKSKSELQVDVDVDALNAEITELTDERDLLRLRVEELESKIAKKTRKAVTV
jgi:chromosome segregation ATPase